VLDEDNRARADRKQHRRAGSQGAAGDEQRGRCLVNICYVAMKLLLVADLHANWPALRAVLASARDVDAVLCLGDIVNYGPHPVPCVEWAQHQVRPGWIVQGNHDHALGRDEDPRCSAPYRALAAAMQRYTASQLTVAAKEFLANLPQGISHKIEGARFFLCHAVPTDQLHGYVQADDEARWARECAVVGNPDFVVVGHTHRPFIRQIGETTVVNPGSVGQPKDGDARASYALWHDGKVTLHRATYDIEAVTRDLAVCASDRVATALSNVLLTGGILIGNTESGNPWDRAP
jgi:putative phosphoesterase